MQIIKNTQPSIIDEDTYNAVQRIRSKAKRCPDKSGAPSKLTGLMHCADCGSKMYIHRISNGKNIPHFLCSSYCNPKLKARCGSSHRIKEESVLLYIEETLKRIFTLYNKSHSALKKKLELTVCNSQGDSLPLFEDELKAVKLRISELEILLCHAYEDSITGKLDYDAYIVLEKRYMSEQKSLNIKKEKLIDEIKQQHKSQNSVAYFISLLEKYKDFKSLTPLMLNEFIYRINVYERDYRHIHNSPQKIEIIFNHIGSLDV